LVAKEQCCYTKVEHWNSIILIKEQPIKMKKNNPLYE